MDLIVAFLISITILLIVQHFGECYMIDESGFRMVGTGRGYYNFSSPIDNHFDGRNISDKYFSDTPIYVQKLTRFYFPSIFIEGYTWLLIMTLIVFAIIRLKRKFSKHYKVKIE